MRERSVLRRTPSKGRAGRRSADGSHDVAAESAQLKAAQRQLIELRTARERAELIPASEALAILSDVVVRDTRDAILTLPQRAKGELPQLLPSELAILDRLARDMLRDLVVLGSKPLSLRRDVSQGSWPKHMSLSVEMFIGRGQA